MNFASCNHRDASWNSPCKYWGPVQYKDAFLTEETWWLSYPGIPGVTLCFCTGSYVAAAFCSHHNFSDFFHFGQDWRPWPIDYQIIFWLILAMTLTWKVKYVICYISDKNGVLATKEKAIEFKASNVTIGFDLGHDSRVGGCERVFTPVRWRQVRLSCIKWRSTFFYIFSRVRRSVGSSSSGWTAAAPTVLLGWRFCPADTRRENNVIMTSVMTLSPRRGPVGLACEAGRSTWCREFVGVTASSAWGRYWWVPGWGSCRRRSWSRSYMAQDNKRATSPDTRH